MNIRPDLLMRQASAAKHIKDALQAYEDEDLTIDTIEGQTDFVSLVDALMASIAEDESLVAGIKVREGELDERKDRLSTRVKKKRSIVERALLLADMSKLQRPEYTLSIRAGQQRLDVLDEALIPPTYFKQPAPVLDRAALNEALKNGESVIGARLSNGETSLAIRRK